MPLNPFMPQNQPEESIKRNDFDLSNSSVFTTDFFKLYPAFCKEVLPGDTFEIDFALGVRGMPTVFPVQTKMRMSMEFYYVRNRTLHDKFEDMIFKTKDVEHPWIRLTRERAKQMVSTGSLGDALGVPTTFATESQLISEVGFSNLQSFCGDRYNNDHAYDFNDIYQMVVRLLNNHVTFELRSPLSPAKFQDQSVGYITGDLTEVPSVLRSEVIISNGSDFPRSSKCFIMIGYEPSNNTFMPLSEPYEIEIKVHNVLPNRYYLEYVLSDDDLPLFRNSIKNALSERDNYRIAICNYNMSGSGPYYADPSSPFFPFSPTSGDLVATSFYYEFLSNGVVDSTDDLVIGRNPFVGENPDIRLNALPFRAYEQICNYYYRNDKNNPYYLDGEPQYNEFIPSHASGPDDNVYDFHYRNWELDCFTSSQQSPQFGDAPLVGLTWQGSNDVELEFQATNTETSQSKNYKVRVGLDDDDNVDSILDFSPDVPSADLQRLQRRIQAGLSINDLRVTNSFQRFLENTMRRGLRYRNQLKSHFGVSVDYPDIDVPQYIGGFSSELDTGQVTNMADSPNAGLGDYIGTLQGSMSSQNTIRQYCPEHGFIIGVFSMSPVPSYPQSINPYMLHDGAMTYYQTEFRHIGFVPIRHKLLDPLQTPLNGSVNDVFGYQMANYEYKRSLDEVHGDFRTTLRDWVLTRTFKERPTLTESFTVGKPEQLNDVFVTQNIADAYGSNAKFLCSARFHCVALRQIPIVGTPALE